MALFILTILFLWSVWSQRLEHIPTPTQLSMSESEPTGPFWERSFEVEELSCPEAPPINGNHSCLEPSQSEPNVHANCPILTNTTYQYLLNHSELPGVSLHRRGWPSSGGWWWKQPPCHHPPAQPRAKFDCNSQVLTHRGQSLTFLQQNMPHLKNLRPELDQNQSAKPLHTHIRLFSFGFGV